MDHTCLGNTKSREVFTGLYQSLTTLKRQYTLTVSIGIKWASGSQVLLISNKYGLFGWTVRRKPLLSKKTKVEIYGYNAQHHVW